jgi:glycosyltransferase involved in cell wall biosynthesis
MRILTATNMYPFPGITHYGIFVEREVKSLRELGVEVQVYFINGKMSRLNYFKAVWELVGVMRRFKPDIIHVHHSYTVYPTKIARMISGIKAPIVFTLHEGAALSDRRVGSGDFFNRLRHWKAIKKIACETADFVIAVNKSLLDALNYTGPFAEIPCGVDTDFFRPMDGPECRKKLQLPANKKIVFFPASIERAEKGYELFSRSIAILDGKIKVVLGGRIDPEDMPLYYNASDVVAQTSFYEASPITIKEALACNVPVVSTRVGDVERLMEGVEGCFVSSPNHIEFAINISNAIEFGKRTNGRKRILELGYDMRGTAKKILAVYEELLKKSR